jgi:hypothetical protein
VDITDFVTGEINKQTDYDIRGVRVSPTSNNLLRKV